MAAAAGLGAPASIRTSGRGVSLPPNANPRRRSHRRPRAAAANNAGDSAENAQKPPVALLLEIDGALVDVVQQGHRVAFNKAFAEMGLPPSAAWDPPAFEAALRAVPALGGTGEALIASRLDRAGAWPPSLLSSAINTEADTDSSISGGGAGSPRQAFARRVHEAKQRAFADLLSQGRLPLRPDVASVVDGALAAGCVVALVAETASAPEEGVAGAALRALGEARAARVRVLTAGARRPREQEEEEEAEDGGGGAAGGAGALKAAVARQKAAAAREFAQRFDGGPLIDVSALTGSGAAPEASLAAEAIPPAFFAASAALLGASPARCVCVCATVSAVRAAAAAGMVAVAVPRQAAFDVSFPDARAKFEAYGPGYVSWARLAAMVEADAAAAGTRW